MKVSIELLTGPYPGRNPTQQDISKQIDVIKKAIDGKPLTGFEQILLVDVQSIMQGIKEQLP